MACRRNSFRPAWKFQKPDLEDKGFYNIPIQKQTFGRVEPLLFLNINHNVYLIIHQKVSRWILEERCFKGGQQGILHLLTDITKPHLEHLEQIILQEQRKQRHFINYDVI